MGSRMVRFGSVVTHPLRAALAVGGGAITELFPAYCATAVTAAAAGGWTVDAPAAYCPRCGASVGPGAATPRGCSACLDQRLPWGRVVRLAAYRPPVAGWIVALKFARAWSWGPWFGHELAAAIGAGAAPVAGTTPTPGPTAVCPVPLHWLRRCRRGYNQAHLIAAALAAARGWPLAPLLHRTRYTPPQTTVQPSRRAANVRAAFALRNLNLAGWTIWLVDDVKTSGATLHACARLLRQAGAAEVNVAVVAVAEAKGRQITGTPPTFNPTA